MITHLTEYVNKWIRYDHIDGIEARYFTDYLFKQTKKFSLVKTKLKLQTPYEDMMDNAEISKIISINKIAHICNRLRKKQFDRNQRIPRTRQNRLLYISRGVIKSRPNEMNHESIIYSKGDIFGWQWLNENIDAQIQDFYAETICIWYEFEVSDILNQDLDEYEESRLWCYIATHIIKLMPEVFPKFHYLSHEDIRVLVYSCDYKIYEKDDIIELWTGGILMEGTVIIYQNSQEEIKTNFSDSKMINAEDWQSLSQTKGYAMINPTEDRYIASKTSVILHLPQILKHALLSPDLMQFNHDFQKLDRDILGVVDNKWTIVMREDNEIRKFAFT